MTFVHAAYFGHPYFAYFIRDLGSMHACVDTCTGRAEPAHIPVALHCFANLQACAGKDTLMVKNTAL